MSTFDEIVSLSLNGLIVSPVLLFFVTKDHRWLFILLYSIINIQVHDIIKSHSRKYDYKFLKRPIGAKKCDIFSRNGNVEGEPGFPSGHVTTTVSLFTGMYLLYPEYRTYIILNGTMYSVLMAMSRINKKCHTPLQTIAGGILGIFGTLFFNYFIHPK